MKEIQRSATFDINDATLDELVSIHGLGKKLAKQIIDLRPYSELHDLVKVSGINEKKLESLLPFLTIKLEKKTENLAESLPFGTKKKPTTRVGNTEAFVFLENRNERMDALLIMLGGFFFGLVILLLRRSRD